jgi:predicted GNAT family N-acyltransferase
MELVELTIDEVRPLRTAVLRPHYEEGRLANFEGDEDDSTHHYGLRADDGAVVAVLTFMRTEAPEELGGPAVRLRGMAVAEERRREGIGARLLQGSLTRLAVAEPDLQVVWCNARTSAADFYAREGFRRHGEVFDVPEIGPHVVMWRAMPTAEAVRGETTA